MDDYLPFLRSTLDPWEIYNEQFGAFDCLLLCECGTGPLEQDCRTCPSCGSENPMSAQGLI